MFVRNLFKNLPVRKQYYSSNKKRKEELKKVEDLVLAFGIINSGVRFSLTHGRDLLWQKNAVVDTKSALLNALGTGVVANLEHMRRKSSQAEVRSYSSPPFESLP